MASPAPVVTPVPLHLPVLSLGPKNGKRILTAERVIESLVVPCYPQTSECDTSGVLTMVPVVSVEKTVNPKSFIAYKCPSGQSRTYRSVLSPQFGFCSYNWVEYPCSGVESCDLVPNQVLALSHSSVREGQHDNYATYEKLFAEASGATDGANAEQQALSRAWDKYATVVVPFDERDCPNSVCGALPRPPPGKLVTVTATGHTFLGCAGYTASNRVGHKNSSLTNVTNLDAIRLWVREKRYAKCARWDALRVDCVLLVL